MQHRLANLLNAQKSTGPRSSAGKAKSATNSTKHGLQAQPSTLFAALPDQHASFESLRQQLFAQCLPEGAAELEAFERYAFNLFQSRRARSFEIDAFSRFSNEPNSETLLRSLDRIVQIASQLERRADRALNELRKLQADRCLAADVQNEMYLFEQQVPVPASLPLAQLRRSHPSVRLAAMLLTLDPPVQQLFADLRQRQSKLPKPEADFA
jgi:hypothetical protein